MNVLQWLKQLGPMWVPSPEPTLTNRLEHKMLPLTQERLRWVEARLFTLARTANELSSRSQAYVNRIPNGGGAVYMQSLMNIGAERLELMAEQQVIEDYLRDNPSTT